MGKKESQLNSIAIFATISWSSHVISFHSVVTNTAFNVVTNSYREREHVHFAAKIFHNSFNPRLINSYKR